MNEIKEYKNKLFEDIKHIDEEGNEYWEARELQKVLEYTEWRNFLKVINQAISACENSKLDKNIQFVEINKTLINVNGGKRKILDYKLTRYACYLIAQNGDPRKEVIALAQSYFAIQTRKQEILVDYLKQLQEKDFESLTEDDKRLYQRRIIKKENILLNETAKEAGVKNFDVFTNYGYKGLYNGETANDIYKRKKLRYHEDILDNMSSEELGANLFRITEAEAKLKRDNVKSQNTANKTHYEVGKEVRNTLKRLGSVMPEDMMLPDKSTKQLEKEIKYKKGIK